MGNKNFQEKRSSTRRTQEKHSTGKEELFESKKNQPVTYDNARKTIFEWVKQGRNYREIAQIPFNIIGWDKPKKFSISEISRIKNHNVEYHTLEKNDPIDEKKTEIFDLLDKNTHPRNIVIITKYSPALVKETTLEYLELDDYSPQTIKELVNIAKEFNCNIQNTIQLKDLFWKALDYYAIYASMLYYCCRCGKPVYLTPDKNESWEEDIFDGLNYLSKNNWHPGCVV